MIARLSSRVSRRRTSFRGLHASWGIGTRQTVWEQRDDEPYVPVRILKARVRGLASAASCIRVANSSFAKPSRYPISHPCSFRIRSRRPSRYGASEADSSCGEPWMALSMANALAASNLSNFRFTSTSTSGSLPAARSRIHWPRATCFRATNSTCKISYGNLSTRHFRSCSCATPTAQDSVRTAARRATALAAARIRSRRWRISNGRPRVRKRAAAGRRIGSYRRLPLSSARSAISRNARISCVRTAASTTAVRSSSPRTHTPAISISNGHGTRSVVV